MLQQIDSVMTTNRDVYGCARCHHDIAAMALTILPARYVVTPKGETFTRIKTLEQQFTVNIITALTEGIEIVKKHPHHGGIGD